MKDHEPLSVWISGDMVCHSIATGFYSDSEVSVFAQRLVHETFEAARRRKQASEAARTDLPSGDTAIARAYK